jgi:DNA-binding NtrC family response regulator
VGGKSDGAEIVRDAGVIMVGSDPGADLVVEDPTVSRRHVELTVLHEGVLVADQGSKNGTRLNKRRVTRELAVAGDTITIGKTKLRVSAVEESRRGRGEFRKFGGFVTRSPKMEAILEKLERIATGGTSCVIEGETGTGKDVLARAIHEASPRRDAPFTVVDLAAVSRDLLESQLFGHTKGSFTGAVRDQIGAFEASDGGTVLLDEIGELPLELQPKLLRVLETRRVKRLGDSEERAVDIRVLAATNKDLRQMVQEKAFRPDLLFRVAVSAVHIPPLRERPEDVALLARHFIRALGGDPAHLTRAAEEALELYSWPGNARELRNVMERSLLLAPGRAIAPADLFPQVSALPVPGRSFREAKEQVLLDFERLYVKELLERYGGNVSQAARAAGLTRNALYALMKRAGLA